MTRYISAAFLIATLLLTSVATAQTVKQEKKKPLSASEQVAMAAKKLNKNQTYKLAYKLEKGEKLAMTVEQVVSTKFQMAGEMEDSSSRSASSKTWKVINVDSLGNITFSLVLDSIDMWQQVGEADPVSYNSKTDKEIPTEYKISAEFVGKTLAVFSISPQGKVLDRKSSLKEGNFGVGKVTIPLPKNAVPVGTKWHVPSILEATDDNGVNRKLKARIAYTLDKVKDGNAYIKFRTEVLTPITSEKIRSTIMQKLTNGFVVFDIAKGRPVLKRVEWDEKAQGFEGPDSFLQYVGRMSEKLVATDSKKPKASYALSPIKESTARKPVVLKTRDGKPVMRK